MSYKSIKRALGETSLERKCRFLFGACLLLLITASFWSYGILTERVVYEQNQIRGQLLVDCAIQNRHMENLASILSILRNKDKSPPSQNDQDSMKSDAALIQDITKLASKQEFEWSFIWANSTDDTNRPHGKYEQELLEKYKNKPSPARRPIMTFPNSMKDRPKMTNIFITKQFARIIPACCLVIGRPRAAWESI